MKSYFPMLKAVFALLLMLPFHPANKAGGEAAAWFGTWEGESKCTIPNSPCHDEHVIYEIKGAEAAMNMDGYKVVNGEKQFMGTLACGAVKGEQVSCSAAIPNKKRIDEWVFQRKEKTLDGTLYLDKERTVFRRIHVEKK
jgi:hypothetical protein